MGHRGQRKIDFPMTHLLWAQIFMRVEQCKNQGQIFGQRDFEKGCSVFGPPRFEPVSVHLGPFRQPLFRGNISRKMPGCSFFEMQPPSFMYLNSGKVA